MPRPALATRVAACIAAFCSAHGAAPTQEPDGPRRPNVLLILADDLGFSDLGCYGGEIPTPHLDRLAAGGARFEACYNSARCCPSRASLLTGLHPHQAGVGSFATARPRAGGGPAYAGHLLPNTATLAHALGAAGYSTWMVGKWHLGVPGPIESGFANYWGLRDMLAYSADQWDTQAYARLPEGIEPELSHDPATFYATDAFTDWTLEFLDQARRERDRPWFLYLAHSAPHFPVQAPKATIDHYVAVYRRGWDALRAERFARMKTMGLVPSDAELPPRGMVPVDDDAIANGYAGEPNPAWADLPADRREDLARRMATYAAMVEHLDRGVGRILADLEANAELDDTLILFLSDNGACYEWGPFGFDEWSRRGVTELHQGDELAEIGQPGTWQSYGSAWANLGNTPLKLYKHFCHEGGISSPLIVHWPARVAPTAGFVAEPTHLMDVAPTVLAATGATWPTHRDDVVIQPVEGVPLWPAIDGGSLGPRDLAFEHQQARALRRGRWKAVWGKRMPEAPRWELYDVVADRAEQHDLSAEQPERTAELAAAWETWARRVGAEPFYRSETVEQDGRSDPEIAMRPLTIRCRIDTGDDLSATGVLLAQGGRTHGWALHLVAGRPAFDVRRGGVVTRVIADATVAGEVQLVAVLTPQSMVLRHDATVLAERESPGLIPSQPVDGLDVGADGRTAAGDYAAPNPFAGQVLEHRVETGARQENRREPPPSYGRAPAGPAMPADLEPLFDHWMRDTYVTRGPDGAHYLTGTTAAPDRDFDGRPPHCWDWNDGLYLWRSMNMVDWQPLGRIWSLDDEATWQSGFAQAEPFTTLTGDHGEGRKRAVWAPELHWIESVSNWFVVACMNDSAGGQGSFVLRSTSGRPEGPYANIDGNAEGPLVSRIDGSLFEDRDGSVWFVCHNHHFARMKPDMSGLAEPLRRFDETPYAPEPYLEGAFLFRHDDRYHLLQAAWSFRMPDGTLRYDLAAERDGGERWSYDLVIASAPELEGPYGPRYTAGVGIGHDNLFRAADGRIFATAFGNPRTDYPQPFRCRPAIVEMAYDDGRFRIAAPGTPPTPPGAAPKPPNFVVILADDQGWGTTSIAYDPAVPDSRSDFFRTPALERLAAAGMRFTQAYAAHPNCSPSRAALLTGRSPAALHLTDIVERHSGAYYEGNRLIPPRHVAALDSEDLTTPERLKAHDARYRTAHFGKWHLRGGGPEAHGFDAGDGATGNREGTLATNLPDDPKQCFGITRHGSDWLEQRALDRAPFYLQLSHYATHLGYQSRPSTAAAFANTRPGERHAEVRFAAMLADLDTSVGQVLDALDRLGLADKTYVIYTADNGTYPTDDPANVNGPLRGTKATLWEGGVRVPFLVRGPDIAADSVCRVPVTGQDIHTTVCRLAGIDAALTDPNGRALEGADLTPALLGRGTIDRPRDALFFHWPHYQHQKGGVPTTTIVANGRKLHWLWEEQRAALYDLNADLGEQHDLATAEPALTQRLTQRLFAWLDAVDARRPTPNPHYDPTRDPARRSR